MLLFDHMIGVTVFAYSVVQQNIVLIIKLCAIECFHYIYVMLLISDDV